MVQDDRPTSPRKWGDRQERFVQRFAGNESPGKAVPRSQPPDPTGHTFLGGEPEDEIAQRIRGRIRLFARFAVENLTEQVRMTYPCSSSPAQFSRTKRMNGKRLPFMWALEFHSEHLVIKDVF